MIYSTSYCLSDTLMIHGMYVCVCVYGYNSYGENPFQVTIPTRGSMEHTLTGMDITEINAGCVASTKWRLIMK